MRTVVRPGSLEGRTFLPAVMPTERVQIPTGRYFARVGDLLDANMRLGNMVNIPAATQTGEVMGHSVGNLNALRRSLSDAITQALPAGQRELYVAARQTSREVAQANAGMRFLEKYVNPTERVVNGAGLYKALTEGGGRASRAEVLQRRFGPQNYRQILDFARSVQRITSTPEKVPALMHVLSGVVQGAGLGGTFAVGGAPAAAAAVGGRLLYGLATSKAGLRALDAMARSPVGSQAFLAATGRLALSHALLAREFQPQPSPESVDALLAQGAP
jgi:hypothetical protein